MAKRETQYKWVSVRSLQASALHVSGAAAGVFQTVQLSSNYNTTNFQIVLRKKKNLYFLGLLD